MGQDHTAVQAANPARRKAAQEGRTGGQRSSTRRRGSAGAERCGRRQKRSTEAHQGEVGTRANGGSASSRRRDGDTHQLQHRGGAQGIGAYRRAVCGQHGRASERRGVPSLVRRIPGADADAEGQRRRRLGTAERADLRAVLGSVAPHAEAQGRGIQWVVCGAAPGSGSELTTHVLRRNDGGPAHRQPR